VNQKHFQGISSSSLNILGIFLLFFLFFLENINMVFCFDWKIMIKKNVTLLRNVADFSWNFQKWYKSNLVTNDVPKIDTRMHLKVGRRLHSHVKLPFSWFPLPCSHFSRSSSTSCDERFHHLMASCNIHDLHLLRRCWSFSFSPVSQRWSEIALAWAEKKPRLQCL